MERTQKVDGQTDGRRPRHNMTVYDGRIKNHVYQTRTLMRNRSNGIHVCCNFRFFDVFLLPEDLHSELILVLYLKVNGHTFRESNSVSSLLPLI